MFRNPLLIFALLVLSSCVPTLTYRDFEDPIFFANQRAGGTCIECPFKTGLMVAIWPDGRILRALSEETVGNNYVYGHMSSRDIENTIALVQELYESDIDSPGVIIDFSYRFIWVFPVSDPDQSATFLYTIGEEGYQPDSALGQIMDIEIISGRELRWDQLPRFGSGVWGVWTTR